MRRFIFFGFLFLSLTTVSASAFSSSFSWCDIGSPEISLSGVPKGTVELDVVMSDLDKPDLDQGGGMIAYIGQSQIRCGALPIKGPSPPSGTHHYSLGISAIGTGGKTLGISTSTQPFTARRH
jgi:phosphatidylethanolamine-binding protein (PEBP) family uncharacterized protein